MRSRLMLCAESIIRDGESNNISAINIFEEIHPPSLPIIVPRMSILSMVLRDEADPEVVPFQLRITLAGQVVFEQQGTYDFQGRPALRNITVFGGMPITQPGVLDFVILVNDAVFQTYQVLITPPPGPTATPSASPSAPSSPSPSPAPE